MNTAKTIILFASIACAAGFGVYRLTGNQLDAMGWVSFGFSLGVAAALTVFR